MGFKHCFRFVLMGFNGGLMGNHGIARDLTITELTFHADSIGLHDNLMGFTGSDF